MSIIPRIKKGLKAIDNYGMCAFGHRKFYEELLKRERHYAWHDLGANPFDVPHCEMRHVHVHILDEDFDRDESMEWIVFWARDEIHIGRWYVNEICRGFDSGGGMLFKPEEVTAWRYFEEDRG